MKMNISKMGFHFFVLLLSDHSSSHAYNDSNMAGCQMTISLNIATTKNMHVRALDFGLIEIYLYQKTFIIKMLVGGWYR